MNIHAAEGRLSSALLSTKAQKKDVGFIVLNTTAGRKYEESDGGANRFFGHLFE